MHRTDGRSGRCEFARRRAMDQSNILYVGLDVHKDRISNSHFGDDSLE
jgi:hypothetical protein